MKLHICTYVRVICVNNKLLAGRKCDISVCTADIFKPRDYLVRGKSVFSYCGIISLTRPDQGQKFVAVLKAKNRGAATSQNAKNRGIVAAKIVKIAAVSRQKS